MSQLKVVLVGLPGAGKSTFGRMLARELNVEFLDLDQLIEQKSGKKISDIFSEYGEGKFRDLETQTLEEVLNSNESFVLASGGGCPCFNDNMTLINQLGISVFLDVPLEEVSNRLYHSKASIRPMFEGMDAGEITLKLKNLIAQRSPFYEEAKIKLSGSDFSAEYFVSELIHQLKTQS
ncbi:shikimate kinase [Algoriphagus limi]|uniref:Shikimate kinase n=1 Tax=Algoriphagus limi TaxID=2975273 RepID=A0ABT2G6X3_9BACT|nr:shikimate kinase [Algoriphagus limi]MCS5489760.1 shikimate kinase [Algoriphagus limi]